MTIVGLKKIGFVEQNEVNDVWVQQELPAQRGENDPVIENIRLFGSIDQSVSTLTEQTVDEADGMCFECVVSFAVRTQEDMRLARKYTKRPVVLHCNAVDGRHFAIGTKEYPVRMQWNENYDGTNTHEAQISVKYRTLTGILTR